MKRWFVMLPLVALVSACSQEADDNTSHNFDVQDSRQGSKPLLPTAVETESAADTAAGPAIGVTAAPGVAFSYRYAFRLPNAQISAVQEQHAQMCEKLGIARCKITGMRYRLIDEDDVSARLELKLDPSIARQFGKDAGISVTKAEGMVVDTEISGVDVGGSIKAADRTIARARDEMARIEGLLKSKQSEERRLELLEQLADLRLEVNGSKAQKSDAQDSLATTPMSFDYGSGSAIPGFDGGSPIINGFTAGVASFMTMIGAILFVGLSILPWIALTFGLFWLWRRFRPLNWIRRKAEAVETDSA